MTIPQTIPDEDIVRRAADVLLVTRRTDLCESLSRGVQALRGEGRDLRVDVAPGFESALEACAKSPETLVVLDASIADFAPPTFLVEARRAGIEPRCALVHDAVDGMMEDSMRELGFVASFSMRQAYAADFARKLARIAGQSPSKARRSVDHRRVIDSLAGAAVAIDGLGRIVSANDEFGEAAGTDAREIAGRGVAEFFPELGAAALKNLRAGEERLLELRRRSGNALVTRTQCLQLGSNGDGLRGLLLL